MSIVRRAGRWRAAWLGLTGTGVDAATALAWGLVDDEVPAAPADARGTGQIRTSAR